MTGERAVLPALLALAAALRLPGLDSASPGLYRDEALEGLQGLYHWRGWTVEGGVWFAFSRFPLWEALQAVSTGVLGPTILAIRLPAAACGIATVGLVYVALRRVYGNRAALAGAGLLATSFWHVQISRVGHAPVLVGLLAAAILMLGVRLREAAGGRAVRIGALAGVLAGAGLLAYYAGVHLPLAAILLAAGAAPRERRRTVLAAAAAAGVVWLALFARPDLLQAIRARPEDAGESWLAGFGMYARALVLPGVLDPVDRGFWGIYPRGAALLRPWEAVAMLGGIAGVVGGAPAARRLALVAAGWLLLALATGPLAGGLMYHRVSAALVPVAVLQAAGAARIAGLAPGWFPALAAGLIAVNGLRTADLWFRVRAADPRMAVWADGLETGAALDLRERAAAGIVGIASPVEYARTPHLAFLLDRELRSGRIRRVPPPARQVPAIVRVFREPIRGQPGAVLFRLNPARDPVPLRLLAPPDALLEVGDAALAAGDLPAAIAHDRNVLRTFPDLGVGWARLARALARSGDPGSAVAAWRTASRYGLTPE